MKGTELLRLLKKNGWRVVSVRGSHHKLTKAGYGSIIVPVHRGRDIPKGTLSTIMKQVGLE